MELKKIDQNKVSSEINPNVITVLPDGNDESSDDDDDDDDCDIKDGPIMKRHKAKPKTRAQRNKIRERKTKEHLERHQKAAKKLTHDLQRVKSITKELVVQETKNVVDVKQQSKLSVMSYNDAGAVLLTDELTGNLRTLKPVVCPIKSHIMAMVETGELVGKNNRKRRAYEKPHQAKQVKWVARHKY